MFAKRIEAWEVVKSVGYCTLDEGHLLAPISSFPYESPANLQLMGQIVSTLRENGYTVGDAIPPQGKCLMATAKLTVANTTLNLGVFVESRKAGKAHACIWTEPRLVRRFLSVRRVPVDEESIREWASVRKLIGSILLKRFSGSDLAWSSITDAREDTIRKLKEKHSSWFQ